MFCSSATLHCKGISTEGQRVGVNHWVFHQRGAGASRECAVHEDNDTPGALSREEGGEDMRGKVVGSMSQRSQWG